MNKSQVEQYQKRWQTVAEIEISEQRRASPAQRWYKLNAIIRMAMALGLTPEKDAAQKRVVYQRWNELRKMYLADIEGMP